MRTGFHKLLLSIVFFAVISTASTGITYAGTYTVKWVGVKSVNDTLHLNFVSTVSNVTISVKGIAGKYADVFPLSSPLTEWANYEIKINGSNITIYNVTGAVKATLTDTNFWANVNSTGADIRITNKTSELYFWIESFNYTTETADIWVNLTAGSTELDLIYGNPNALPSSYNNISKVALAGVGDDFDDGVLSSLWRTAGGGTISESGGLLAITGDGTTTTGIYSSVNISYPAIAYAKIKHAPNRDTWGFDDYLIYSAVKNQVVSWYPDQVNLIGWYMQTANGGTASSTRILSTADTNWHIEKITWKLGEATLERIGEGISAILTTNVPSVSIPVSVKNWGTGTTYIDWIFVAKLADPANFGTPYQTTAANVTVGTYNIQVIANGTPVAIPSTAFTTDTPVNITYHLPFNATLTFNYAYSSTATITDTGTVIEKNFSINTTGLTTNVSLNIMFPLRTKDYALYLKLTPSAAVTNTTTNTSVVTSINLLNNTTYSIEEKIGYLIANITGKDELSNTQLTSITVNYTSPTGLASKSGATVKLYGTDFPLHETEEVIDFSSAGYSRRHYILDCTALNQSITLYLLQDAVSTMITYTVVSGTSTLDHAKVEIYKYIGDSWKLIDSQYSDASGVVAVPLHAFDVYKVVASKPGYTTVTTTITISQATYTIKLGGVSLAIPASTRTVIVFKPSSSVLQPGTNTISVSIVPQGGKTITSATMTVYANDTPVATVTKTDITSPTDLTATVNLNESTPVSVKVSYIVDGQTITETKNYTVPQATGIWATFLLLNSQLEQTKGGNLIGLLIASFIALAVVASLAATTNTTARGLGFIGMLVFSIIALPLNAISINLLIVIWVSVVATWVLWRMI